MIQGKTIDAWLAALKDRDPAVRKRAVEVLGERTLDPAIPADEKSRLQTDVRSLMFSDKDRGSPASRRVLRGSVQGCPILPRWSSACWSSEGAPSTRRGGRSAWSMPRADRSRVRSRAPIFSVTPTVSLPSSSPEPIEAATSNARGVLALKLEIPGHLDGAGIYAIRQDEDRPLVGLRKVHARRARQADHDRDASGLPRALPDREHGLARPGGESITPSWPVPAGGERPTSCWAQDRRALPARCSPARRTASSSSSCRPDGSRSMRTAAT